MSNDLRGVFTRPMALARRSPQVGGFSALVDDHTPAGGFCIGFGLMPQPEMLIL